MPAHIKSSLFGADVMIPNANGSLVLGTWQGVGWESIVTIVEAEA